MTDCVFNIVFNETVLFVVYQLHLVARRSRHTISISISVVLLVNEINVEGFFVSFDLIKDVYTFNFAERNARALLRVLA